MAKYITLKIEARFPVDDDEHGARVDISEVNEIVEQITDSVRGIGEMVTCKMSVPEHEVDFK